jgi:hypothetical protein
LVALLKFSSTVRLLSRGLEALDLPIDSYSLTWRKGKPLCHTFALAETALHAFVHKLVGGRIGF